MRAADSRPYDKLGKCLPRADRVVRPYKPTSIWERRVTGAAVMGWGKLRLTAQSC